MFNYLTNMKHCDQTIIHHELFGEDNWGRGSSVSFNTVQKLIWRLKKDDVCDVVGVVI